MTYTDTCVYIVSLKTFMRNHQGKTREGKKSTIYVI